MTTTIQVRDLRVTAVVGILPEERSSPQQLRLDLDVDVGVPDAASSDDVADTVDYGQLCELAAGAVTTRRPRLLETACDVVASAVLGADERVSAVSVTVTKLHPPIAFDGVTAGVRLRVDR